MQAHISAALQFGYEIVVCDMTHKVPGELLSILLMNLIERFKPIAVLDLTIGGRVYDDKRAKVALSADVSAEPRKIFRHVVKKKAAPTELQKWLRHTADIGFR